MIRRLNTGWKTASYMPNQPFSGNSSGKIVFWNIWYGSSAASIEEALLSFDADIFFLSEVNDNSDLLPRLRNHGYASLFVETNSFGKVKGGMALCYRINPLNEPKLVELQRGGRGPLRGGADTIRCYIEASFQFKGKTISIGSTHASFNFLLNSNKCQQEQRKLIREIEKHSSGFIFGGDLNAGPNSAFIKKLSTMFVCHGPPPTEKSWPVRRLISLFFPKQRFDHAFTTPDIKAKAEFKCSKKGTCPSDHLPLVLQIKS